jgi:hypothetical protein
MANGHTVILATPYNRSLAKAMIDRAPHGYVMELAAPKRSNDQNALLWARLSDVSRACPEGRRLTPDIWKNLFLHALDHSIRFEPGLDGNGMVPMGFRSSKLSKSQFADLLTLIEEYGARHGVRWSDEQEKAA